MVHWSSDQPSTGSTRYWLGGRYMGLVSDAVEFVAEWRAYILDATVIGVRPYCG
ncbi:hypothetical protein J5F27_13870 [Schleiferilactobacillus harbinensis]|uniref:hypothetical protein n=1 Tax=Schleiferilactobacillus harbinensis TaxID=304207 RepID=UPI001AAF5912|nr:hypothetical protein [Schleiferilactobacillus harbinensis]